MKLLSHQASFHASPLAFCYTTCISTPCTWQLLCKKDPEEGMNSSSCPSWNSETHFDLIFSVTDHIQFSADACQFSIWYIFLYSFLHSHCHYLDVTKDYLLVFIAPCLFFVNLLYVLLVEQSWFSGLMIMILLILVFFLPGMLCSPPFSSKSSSNGLFHWVSCHLSPPPAVQLLLWHLPLLLHVIIALFYVLSPLLAYWLQHHCYFFLSLCLVRRMLSNTFLY